MNLERTLTIAGEKSAAAETANAELKEFFDTTVVAKLTAQHKVGQNVLRKLYANRPPAEFGWLSRSASGLQIVSCNRYWITVSGRFLPPTTLPTSMLRLSNRQFASQVRAAAKVEKATAKALAEKVDEIDKQRIAARREAEQLETTRRTAERDRTKRLGQTAVQDVTGRPPTKP
jgi:hypothetical protein